MKKSKIILNGIINENPTFVLFLGMCPILATSTSVYSAIGMSVCVFLVLLLSNTIISLVSRITPDEIRIPVYIIIIATIVSAISMLVEAFAPGIYSTLGAYLQLIVVNCIILGRAEAFASKNTVLESFFDALSMGFGFLFAICSIALVREFFGTSGLVFTNPFTGKEIFSFVIAEGKYAISMCFLASMFVVALLREVIGTGAITMNDLNGNLWFKVTIIPEAYTIPLFVQPMGAFLVLGICVAVFTAVKQSIADKKAAKEKAAKAAAKAA